MLLPFAVTETLPDAVLDVEPLLFVATLVVPVLRYDLWAIDSIIRRSAVATFDSPATVVDNTVRATAERLQLPYVAVRRGDRVLASYGAATDAVETWPMLHDGESVGDLVAAPRHGVAAFVEPDRRIMATLAQLVGGSVRAEALTVELLDARQRLVTAREEERRRLRRDLHDGLGPLLTGLGLNLDAATSQLGRCQTKTAEYLGNAKDASTQVISSLRDLVNGLRPPALDELGLAGALKVHVRGLASDAGLELELRVPDDLALPAAVEVAAFRTAVEAVTNAARHSTARRVCVDDHPLVRQGLRAVLDAIDDIHVVAETDNGTDTVRLCIEQHPDVVLMDLQMPGLHGIDATREVRRAAPDTAVLVLTMFDDDDTVFAAIAAGAAGYLLKGSDGADIVAAVRAAAAGQAVFGAALAKRLQTWLGRPSGARDRPFPELTDREREILDGVAAGLTNAEIGNRLYLAPKTVANNVTTILGKRDLHRRSPPPPVARRRGQAVARGGRAPPGVRAAPWSRPRPRRGLSRRRGRRRPPSSPAPRSAARRRADVPRCSAAPPTTSSRPPPDAAAVRQSRTVPWWSSGRSSCRSRQRS